jgi:hypothetical protein
MGLDVIVDPRTHGRFPSSGNIHLPRLARFGDHEIQALVEMSLNAAARALAADAPASDQRPMNDPVLTEKAIDGRPQLALGGGHLATEDHGFMSGHT